MTCNRTVASLGRRMNDQQIEDYLNRLSDSGDDHSTSQKNYEESDVEDHVELDKMVPTDSDSENGVQPIRSRQQVRRSGVILSSDSETEEIPEKLTEPWLRKRHEIPTLKRCLKRKIAEILGETPTIDTPGPSGTKKKVCGYCDYKKRRMTRFQCKQCKKYMCMDHRGLMCVECADEI
ncbi:unnamed protein product [Colias eurytheme]|nr:unnamed protein product [Colias eurytheme]